MPITSGIKRQSVTACQLLQDKYANLQLCAKNTVAQNVDPQYVLYEHPVCSRNIPFVLIVLSGWGEGREDEYNAINKSNCLAIKTLRNIYPYRWRTLKAHGEWVGLPKNTDTGNGETGNNAMGSGKIIIQRATLVDNAIVDGSIYKSEGWLHAKEGWVYGGTLHFLGLLSDGGVHSRYDQLQHIFKTAVDQQCKKIRFHILLDGRDVHEGTSLQFVEQLEKDLEELRKWGCDARIASGGGRMFVTMDHYNADWRIVKRGWYAHVLGDAPHKFESAIEAITTLKKADPHCNDQYLPPFVLIQKKNGQPWGPIFEEDVVINFNFRSDRMIQISQAFVDEKFDKFERVRWPNVRYVSLMQYDLATNLPMRYLVEPPRFDKLAGRYLSANGVRTFAISETQKMGHITFNWNGNNSGKTHEINDTYMEIQSENVRFELEPEMRAATIANVAHDALLSGLYDFVRVMFANGDMVGHTRDFEATKRACIAVDEGIKLIVSGVELCGGIYMIVGDHGNCDDMVQRDAEGKPQLDACGKPLPKTCHSLDEVPCGIGGPGLHKNVRFRDNIRDAGLANVTATYMNLLGFEAPYYYEPSLLTFDYNPWAFTGVHEDYKSPMDDLKAIIKK